MEHDSYARWPATALDIQNALDEFDSRYLESYHQVTAKMAQSALAPPDPDPALPERSRLLLPLLPSHDPNEYLLLLIALVSLSMPPPARPSKTALGESAKLDGALAAKSANLATSDAKTDAKCAKPKNALLANNRPLFDLYESPRAQPYVPLECPLRLSHCLGPCQTALGQNLHPQALLAPILAAASLTSLPREQPKSKKAVSASSSKVNFSSFSDIAERPPRVQRLFLALSIVHKASGRRSRDRRNTTTTCVGNPFYKAAKTSPRRRRDRVGSFLAVGLTLEFDRSVV